jgi:hypothetical protein
LSVREARSRLFLISLEVARGEIRMIDVDGDDRVLLIGVRELIDILVASGPTFGEAIDEIRRRGLTSKDDCVKDVLADRQSLAVTASNH